MIKKIVPWVKEIIFPHISRIFSAKTFERGGKVFFWIGSISFFIVGTITSHYLPQSYDEYRKAILYHPFSINSYIHFGQALFHQGNRVAASKQIQVATNVLGVQTEFTTLLSEWDYASRANERSYDYWKQIITKYPDYRDGYIRLSQISYDLKLFDETKLYIERAKELDPNNPLIVQMQNEMGL